MAFFNKEMIAPNASQWIKSLLIQFFNSLWKRKSLVLVITILILFAIFALHLNLVSKQEDSTSDQSSDFIKNNYFFFKPINFGNISSLHNVLPRPLVQKFSKDSISEKQETQIKSVILLPNGESSDPEIRKKREFIKSMMRLAWDSYAQYAWGENEFRPISKKGHSPGIFGHTRLGATIVDSMDTLYIMGLKDEFEKGRKWIEENLSFDNIKTDVSLFETTIRYIGGLLACYAFTNDRLFLDKAEHIANKLLPAFNSPKNIPFSLINPTNKFSKNYIWASASSSILSEIGTLHLEFVYLSDMTANPVYAEKVFKIREILKAMKKPKGLYPNYINPNTGRWGQYHISMGALGDSFYEYLLKAWIQSNYKDTDARQMYDEAIAAIEKNLLQRSKSGLLYLADMKYNRIENKMDHLACFAGGLFALGGQSLNDTEKQKFTNIGAEIANTCHESYIRTETKLGPESFRFTQEIEAKATRIGEKYYILRPETLESYFYLWRFTKDSKYRDWAWEVALAIDKYCKVESGYSGLKNVYDLNAPKDDVQQSFFLAETLKYLYLIFSNDDLLPFDKWVFNTEAHPLPIKEVNSAYPKQH